MTNDLRATPGAPLANRELEILRQMANGLQTKQIASRTSLSYNTVKNYQQRIYCKLGALTAAHAVGLAIATRQLKPYEVTVVHPREAEESAA